jgi:hypothetical protein
MGQCVFLPLLQDLYTLPASGHEKITAMESSGLKTCISGDYC